ncbi:MAG TPA: tRNA (N6-isopentenyl adenosine(37)-C2)-methylthiotransferase MiaB, partial [Candidatus Omnitrophota bacterium]|nr:tRNA (N6-isopentenyl adenosine(37)-C2)-methylthiotransferase MiaB [Candidatus Omnitrophota bacterium]
KLPAGSAGKRILLVTFGCQMNVRDAEVIAGLMTKAGYSLTDDEAKADVVIFVTCSVRQHAEDKVWSEIGRIAKQNRAGTVPIIGLVGCMAQNYQQQVFERSPAVDFCVGPADIAQIPDIVTKIFAHRKSAGRGGLLDMKIWETDGSVRPEEIYHTGFYEEKDHAYVVISEGCSNFCTYCIVPFVRGPVRHRHAEDILLEVKEAVAGGITRFTLLGQNVSSYHSPEPMKGKPVDFVDLLMAVSNISGLKEVGFITSHPRDTTVRLFEAMASCDTVKKYLHLPVQSGSDRILAAMNRGYTRAGYVHLAKEYRRIVKGGLLSTDIIVGFPGEADDDFQATHDLVRDIGFDTGYIFKYSPRPNTKACMLADDVAQGEKVRRHKVILDLQKSISKSRKRSVA